MAKILVVGAGVGGATAAALLAKAGHDVTVLEAHIYPGGCAGTFFHKGYRFEAGATLAGGFQPGGPHEIVGRLLDIQWRVQPVNPAWQVHLPDRVITQFGTSEERAAEWARAFQSSCNHKAILRFFKAAERMSDAVWDFASRKPTWPPSNIGDLYRTASALRLNTLGVLPHVFDTMGGWAKRSGVRDKAALTFLDAQLLISAQTTANNASALFGAAAADLPRKGVVHPDGGIGGISDQLVQAIRKFGGQVHFRQEVTKLDVKDGAAGPTITGAHTNKGLHVECDVCIANLTPWDLARLLGDATPITLKRETEARADEWGAFMLFLGIEESASDECRMTSDCIRHSSFDIRHLQDECRMTSDCIRHSSFDIRHLQDERRMTSDCIRHSSFDIRHLQVVADYDRPLGEGNSIFMSFSPQGDARRAPAGHRALNISTHTRAADWWALREKPGAKQEYEDRVAAYADKMIDHAEKAVPGLRSRIRLQLEGTPITYKFYTRRHRGGVGGFPFTSIFNARGPWTGLRNAWLVGDSIFPGQSTAGVTMGALRVADEVLRHAKH